MFLDMMLRCMVLDTTEVEFYLLLDYDGYDAMGPACDLSIERLV